MKTSEAMAVIQDIKDECVREERLEAARGALRFLHDYGGQECEQIPFQLFGALAELTLEQLQAQVPPDKVKFTSNELIERALHRGLKSKPPKEEAARRVSTHWKKLTQWLTEAEEKLIQAARAEQL